MTQLSFDAGNRLPLLDITPVSKSGRAGADPNEQFDSHLNRASSPPTSPASSAASSTSMGSRPQASSSSDSTSSNVSQDESAPANQPASDTPDHGDKATATADTQTTNQSQAKHDDVDQEKDHEGEDDVVLSEASAAVVLQVAAVAVKAEVKVDEESAEGIQIVDPKKEEEPHENHDAMQPKPKKQVNSAEQALPSHNGNKSATEPANDSTVSEVQPTETPQAVPETSDLDATAVSADPLEENVAEGSDAKSLSLKPTTTTIRIKDGQTDETTEVVEDQAETNGRHAKDATDEKQSDETSKLESSTNSARVSNLSPDADSADHTGQQAQEQQDSAAANSDLSPETNFNGDGSSDQGGSKSEQHSKQGAATEPGNKSHAAANSPSENSPSTKQLTSSTEAPVLRAANSSAAASSTSSTEATSAADRARFVHRVYRALHVAHERGGEVRLRLSPPELGNLTLELKLHDGTMTAHIEAETPAARALLLENLPVLKERLAAQDIQVERFDVELRDQSRQHSPDGQPQDSDTSRNTRYVLKKSSMNAGNVAEPGESSAVRPTTSGQLNVII
jgi:flagellar hook-length control protein FliK